MPTSLPSGKFEMETSYGPLLIAYRFNLLHGIILAIPLFMGFPFIIKYVAPDSESRSHAMDS